MKDRFLGHSLIVVGGAWCVWQDLGQIDWENYHILCVNDIYMHFPGDVHHHYSNMWRMLPIWAQARVDRYQQLYSRTTYRHSFRGESVTIWPWPGHGTSALNAVFTGLALGYEKIVLAGVPLDDGGHYYDPRPTEARGTLGTRRYSNFLTEIPIKANKLRYWADAQTIFAGRVKSLSGRTRDLLGSP